MTQSGEVVSHRAHNPGTGGANPSSATKYKHYFMIAIDLTSICKEGGPNKSVWDDIPMIQESYNDIYSFFKNCIDQNLIMNIVICDTDPPKDAVSLTSRYFAISIENAEAFRTALFDTSKSFSMFQLWDENGWDFLISMSEVDFDTATYGAVELIGQFGEIWGIDYQVNG